ncbi:hypothetical protein D9M69_385450 [compost metagenome]
MLGAAELVAGQQHRGALGEQQGGQQVAHLPQAQGADPGIVGGAFAAVVPGQVVVAAVAVVLAVGFVVLVVVGHQVAQGEAIVGGDEVHRGEGPPAALVEQVAGGGEALGELGHLSAIATPEGPRRVAETVVPFRPARGETAHLVAAWAAIPGFGDQLEAAQHRVLAAGHEESVALVIAMGVAGEDGRQVEAEAVHAHLAGPVAQGIGDHLQHAGVAEVEGIAGAGVVDVAAPVAGYQSVVGGVVDAAHAQGRAQLVALGGVVVDHVEDQLQAGVVQVGDHFLELVDLAAGEVGGVGREEGDAVVAPVVVHALFQQVLVVEEGVHRQQLDGGYPQGADVLQQLGVHQPGEGAAQGLRHRRVAHADAAQVGLVDQGAVPGGAHALLRAPGEGRVDDLALGHEGGAVAFVEAEVGVLRADHVAEQRLRPAQPAHQLLGVGVDQQLVGVEAVPGVGLEGTVHPVTVDLPRVGIGQVAMPDLVGVFGQVDALQLGFAAGIEQAQLDLGGVGREQREIDPQAVPGGAQRKGMPLADARATDDLRRMGARPAHGTSSAGVQGLGGRGALGFFAGAGSSGAVSGAFPGAASIRLIAFGLPMCRLRGGGFTGSSVCASTSTQAISQWRAAWPCGRPSDSQI